ncbi:MAG: type II toxin-antitoxin system ParD family antitoxin [Pirellulales bacterium]|nr:type II toxin-antitoxin system ParD family antitoxin [Pirellulales bacterium]
MISPSFPQDLGSFIGQQIAAGKYHSEEELMIHAVRVLREVEARKRQFAEDVQLGFEQLERGESTAYDEAGLRRRYEALKERVQRRVAARGENP